MDKKRQRPHFPRFAVSKKAMVLYYLVVPGIFIGLVTFYMYSTTGKAVNQPRYIGEIELEYLKAAQEAESKAFYMEQAARYSIRSSIFSLASKGGFYDPPGCGEYKGHVLWQSLDQGKLRYCYPKDIKGNFTAYLDDGLNSYVQLYPKGKRESGFYKDNYDFLIEGNLEITGIATIPYERYIYYAPKDAGSSYLAGKYAKKPSFRHQIGYDLNHYALAKARAILLNTECADSPDLRACLKDNMPENWGLGFCPVFPEQEQECLDKNKNLNQGQKPFVPWFGKTWGLWGGYEFHRCDSCPSTGAGCDDYLDEKYCLLDPCNLNCIWENGQCKELTPQKLQEINDARLFSFCALSDDELYHYDQDKKTIEKTPVPIKFAMYIEDPPPEPIEGFSISQNPSSQKSLVLKWKKSPEEDISHYNIYYSAYDFKDKSIDEIRDDPDIFSISLDYDENSLRMFESLDLSGCELKLAANNNIRCLFEQEKLAYPNNLYYIRQDDELFYILYDSGLEEQKGYYISITAVDKGDNEINNIGKEQKLPMIKASPEDTIGPGFPEFTASIEGKDQIKLSWNKPSSNMVNYYGLDDLKSYKIYYQGCSKPDKLDAMIDEETDSPGYTMSADLPRCDPSDTFIYYFIVLAKDSSHNPDLSLDKLKELGLKIKKATITDTGSGFALSSQDISEQAPPIDPVTGSVFRKG